MDVKVEDRFMGGGGAPAKRGAAMIALIVTVLAMAGCAKPWESPGDMAAFQRKHYPDLPLHYPRGMERADVLNITRGRHVATIPLPMDDATAAAYAGTEIAFDLPILITTAEQATGVAPRSVDVLEFFGGASGFGVEARYIFYDQTQRVLAAYGSPWAE